MLKICRGPLYGALILLGSILSVGCMNHPSDDGTNTNTQSLSYIDQGMYDKAIISLQMRLKDFPSDTKTRMLLASTLAAKNGIILIEFSDFANTLMTSNQKSSAVPSAHPLRTKIDMIFDALDEVPEPKYGIKDMNTAVEAIDVENLSTGGYVYRALLKLVIIKYNLHHMFLLETSPGCTVEPQALNQWFLYFKMATTDLLGDIRLSKIDKKERKQVRKTQIKVGLIIDDIVDSLEPHLEDEYVKLPNILRKLYPQCM
jgi:hypothetical protein